MDTATRSVVYECTGCGERFVGSQGALNATSSAGSAGRSSRLTSSGKADGTQWRDPPPS